MKTESSFIIKLGRRGGVGMHLSSLPCAYGIGDIADCGTAFIDRLAEAGLGVWQFLPLGPTAYGDSPYQPLSAFAGNTNLIGMDPLVRLGLLRSDELEPLRSLPDEFVDYGRLIPLKRALLTTVAERLSGQRHNSLLADFEDFMHRNAEQWLDDYALYRVLKTAHGERPWPEWDPEYVHREPSALARARNRYREQIEHTRITQFLFDRQWGALRAYAEERGVCLFGDVPIYIALDSADAWSHREMLLIDRDGRPSHVAGVPPDYFSADGQLWGNPLYDWACHEAAGFAWWIERMRHIMQQVHLVRIDHFRGFESFWSVPYGEQTARGGEWIAGPGDALFQAMRGSLGDLPIVAEDLGVITPEVEALRDEQGFPGMVVLQFEVSDPEFNFDDVSDNSVCYTGTHDNDTTLGWFRGNGDDTRSETEIVENRERVLELTGGTEETVHTDLIRLAFASHSALAVAPMQDFLGLGSDARLNIPGTTLNNWRWRMSEAQWGPQLTDRIGQLLEGTSRKPA